MAEFNPRDVRRAANLSQLQIAAQVPCSIPLVKLYEVGGPTAIADDRKRAAIVAVYERVAAGGLSAQGRVDVESAVRRAG